jgi:hypothetical protein
MYISQIVFRAQALLSQTNAFLKLDMNVAAHLIHGSAISKFPYNMPIS